MSKLGENHERLKKSRWLRALHLAKLLFDDEGYFTDYLDEIEELVKNNCPALNGLVVEFGIKNRQIIWVERRRHFEDCSHYPELMSDDAASVIIDTTREGLSYTVNIGKYFCFDEIRIIACFNNGQIMCKIQPLPCKGQTRS